MQHFIISLTLDGSDIDPTLLLKLGLYIPDFNRWAVDEMIYLDCVECMPFRKHHFGL